MSTETEIEPYVAEITKVGESINNQPFLEDPLGCLRLKPALFFALLGVAIPEYLVYLCQIERDIDLTKDLIIVSSVTLIAVMTRALIKSKLGIIE